MPLGNVLCVNDDGVNEVAVCAALAQLVEGIVGAVRQLAAVRVAVQGASSCQHAVAWDVVEGHAVVRRRHAQHFARRQPGVNAVVLVMPAVLAVNGHWRLQVRQRTVDVDKLAAAASVAAFGLSRLVVAANDQPGYVFGSFRKQVRHRGLWNNVHELAS